jgi:hypothetical protein
MERNMEKENTRLLTKLSTKVNSKMGFWMEKEPLLGVNKQNREFGNKIKI